MWLIFVSHVIFLLDSAAYSQKLTGKQTSLGFALWLTMIPFSGDCFCLDLRVEWPPSCHGAVF